jgi:hypothetical protein
MKKYLLIALALIGATGFITSAQANDYCSGVFLTNGSGSPPVVVGNTVSFIANGYAPYSVLYFDGGAVLLSDPWGNPPGTPFSTGGSITGVANGAHTLRMDWDACTVNFTVVPPPTNPTMTQGYTTWTEGSDIYTTVTSIFGFLNGHFGSMSPTTTDTNKPYQGLYDYRVCTIFGCNVDSSLSIGGWSSNPGQAWLNSVSALGVTKTGASASYSYSGGVATWSWYGSGFNFAGYGTTLITMSHN